MYVCVCLGQGECLDYSTKLEVKRGEEGGGGQDREDEVQSGENSPRHAKLIDVANFRSSQRTIQAKDCLK